MADDIFSIPWRDENPDDAITIRKEFDGITTKFSIGAKDNDSDKVRNKILVFKVKNNVESSFPVIRDTELLSINQLPGVTYELEMLVNGLPEYEFEASGTPYGNGAKITVNRIIIYSDGRREKLEIVPDQLQFELPVNGGNLMSFNKTGGYWYLTVKSRDIIPGNLYTNILKAKDSLSGKEATVKVSQKANRLEEVSLLVGRFKFNTASGDGGQVDLDFFATKFDTYTSNTVSTSDISNDPRWDIRWKPGKKPDYCTLVEDNSGTMRDVRGAIWDPNPTFGQNRYLHENIEAEWLEKYQVSKPPKTYIFNCTQFEQASAGYIYFDLSATLDYPAQWGGTVIPASGGSSRPNLTITLKRKVGENGTPEIISWSSMGGASLGMVTPNPKVNYITPTSGNLYPDIRLGLNSYQGDSFGEGAGSVVADNLTVYQTTEKEHRFVAVQANVDFSYSIDPASGGPIDLRGNKSVKTNVVNVYQELNTVVSSRDIVSDPIKACFNSSYTEDNGTDGYGEFTYSGSYYTKYTELIYTSGAIGNTPVEKVVSEKDGQVLDVCGYNPRKRSEVVVSYATNAAGDYADPVYFRIEKGKIGNGTRLLIKWRATIVTKNTGNIHGYEEGYSIWDGLTGQTPSNGDNEKYNYSSKPVDQIGYYTLGASLDIEGLWVLPPDVLPDYSNYTFMGSSIDIDTSLLGNYDDQFIYESGPSNFRSERFVD